MVQQHARRKVIRDPNTGAPKVVFVNPATGQVVNDTKGHNIIETTGFLSPEDLGIDPLKGKTAAYSNPNSSDTRSGSNAAAGVIQRSVTPNYQNGSGSGLGYGGQHGGSNPSNNFGFVDPTASRVAGVVGLAPGPIGMFGKVAGAAMGATNATAVNEARQSIGLESKGVGTTAAKGAISGFFGRGPSSGQVAEMADQYGTVAPVGFQAVDPATGRTNMTPTEARSRYARGLMTEATPAQVAEAKQSFAEEHGKPGGPLSGLAEATSSFFSSLFGGPSEQGFPTAPSATSTGNTGFSYSDHAFSSSDNTSKSTNADMSVAGQYSSYGQGQHSGDFSGGQAESAADGTADPGLF